MQPAVPSDVTVPVLTRRLRLIPLDARLAHVAVTDRAAFRHALQALVPTDWPAGPVRNRLADRALDADAPPAWDVWAVVHDDARVLVGDAGFKGPPDATGRVEIGYAILPAHRRRGFATETVRALVDWAFRDPRVTRVTATTDAANAASQRVLAKSGLHVDRSNGTDLAWRIDRPRGGGAAVPVP